MEIDLSYLKGKIVRHFKGDYYMIDDVATHCDTNEQYIVYRALYDDCRLYIRPVSEFVSLVDKEKYPESKLDHRFTLVTLNSNKLPEYANEETNEK